MKQHPLVVVIVVFICDLLLPMGVTLPQLFVYHLLNLRCNKTQNKILGVMYALEKHKASTERFLVQTLRMLYLLNTPPAFPPSLCSLMVLCICGENKKSF